MIPGLVFVIILFSLVLIKSAEMVIVAVRRIARGTGVGVFGVSAIILALGTSLPELFVGITSALEGSPNLAFGVVLGSNIANTALVGGFAALFVGKVLVHGEYLKRDVAIALLAGISPMFLALDKSISRVDGLILLMIYFAYTTGFFKRRYEAIGKEQAEESFIYRVFKRFNHVNSERSKEFGRLFLGLALLIFSADMIVRFSTNLAEHANIPVFLVGLFVLAIGTSLPELAFSIRSLEDHEPSMFFGNILGSTIANSTLIVGVTTLISPVNTIAFNEYLVASVFFLIIFTLFWFFIRSKHTLERWEAGLLIILYIIFAIVEFI